ncbi:MAG: hypothetical protein ACFKPT_03855 [Gloeotrichia echinulata GP01]
MWKQRRGTALPCPLEKQGKIIGEITFCYYTKAGKQQDDNSPDWQATRQYIQEYIQLLLVMTRPSKSGISAQVKL